MGTIKEYLVGLVGAVLLVGLLCIVGALVFFLSVMGVELLHCLFLGLNFWGPGDF